MKKIFILITGMVIMASLTLFTSCKKDSGTDNPPTIEVNSPAASAINVDRGETVVFDFIAKANLNSTSDLKEITIIAKYSTGGSETVLDSLVPKAVNQQISISKNYVVPTTASYGATIEATIKVIDKDGQFVEKTYTLTVTNLSDINTYSNMKIGAQGNLTLGSSFATDAGLVYLSADAKTNQTHVDFLYFYDDQNGNKHTIAAPNDAVLASVTSLVGTWSVKNATLFKVVTMTSTDFDAITTSDQIKQKYDLSSATATSKAPQLAALSTYVLFVTTKTKYGIIQINSITEPAAPKESSMDITVKIQQ